MKPGEVLFELEFVADKDPLHLYAKREDVESLQKRLEGGEWLSINIEGEDMELKVCRILEDENATA